MILVRLLFSFAGAFFSVMTRSFSSLFREEEEVFVTSRTKSELVKKAVVVKDLLKVHRASKVI